MRNSRRAEKRLEELYKELEKKEAEFQKHNSLSSGNPLGALGVEAEIQDIKEAIVEVIRNLI